MASRKAVAATKSTSVDLLGDDLFASAVATNKAAPKKQPGTIFALPKDLDPNTGALTPECAALHAAVTEVIDSKKAEDNAINIGDLAKGQLNPYVLAQYVSKVASGGCLPTAPVIISNHLGQALTFVVADKSGQYALSDEQLTMLRDLVGADTVERITFDFRQYSLNAETMQEIAGEVPVGLSMEEAAALPRVHNVVSKIMTDAIKKAVADNQITVDQARSLLKAEVKTKLRKGMFADIASWAGTDAARIKSVIEVLGSTITKYLKP